MPQNYSQSCAGCPPPAGTSVLRVGQTRAMTNFLKIRIFHASHSGNRYLCCSQKVLQIIMIRNTIDKIYRNEPANMIHCIPANRLVLSIAIAAVFTPALGQAQSSNSRAEGVEEIMVTTTRMDTPLSQLPNTVTLIDQQDLSQQISINNDLSTILGNMIPSFSPSRQKMTSSGESLRGRNPLYMVDGVPQSNPLRDGSRDGHTIDPLMLERVEVIHGANAIHGMGASGGIINLITRRPANEWQHSMRVESSVQGEDPGESLGYGGSYTLSGRTGNKDLLASVTYRKKGISYDANGDIIGFDNAQGDTMDSETVNLFLKSGIEWADQRLELTVNHFDLSGNNNWTGVNGDISKGVPTTAIESDVPGEAVSNEMTMLSVNYTHDDFLNQRLRLQVFDQDFAATYGGGTFATFADPAFGGTVFDQSQNNSQKRGFKLTLAKKSLAGLPVNLVYGADRLQDETYQALILTGRHWVPESSYDNLALFAQADYVGIENLNITAGVRHEDSSLDVKDFTTLHSYNGGQFVRGGNPEFSDTLFNVGSTYQLTDTWRLFANYAEGFSMPDVGRVLRGINTPGQDVETFLNLTPIVTENTEAGLEYARLNLSALLSYYTSDADFGQRLQANADGIYSVQRERTEIQGLEVRLQWAPTAADTLGLRAALTDGEYDSGDDGRVDTELSGANMSPDRINLSWDRTWTPAINSRLQLNVLQDRNFRDSSGTVVTRFDGYVTLDAYLEAGLPTGSLRLGLQNLSNEDYFTYFSQTQGSDSRNFKGIGRSISLSYNIQL